MYQETNLLDASITVSRSEKRRVGAISNDFKSINPIGSVAYKLALVSSGNYDIFTTIAPKNGGIYVQEIVLYQKQRSV